MKYVVNLTCIMILLAQLTVLQAAEPGPPEGFRAIFNGKEGTSFAAVVYALIIISPNHMCAGDQSICMGKRVYQRWSISPERSQMQ